MGANGSGRTQATAGASPAAGAGSRVAWVDAAKGLSIVLVVLHHAVYFLDTSGLAPLPVVAGNEALASLRMPLFFLASGLFVAGPLAAPWRTLLHKRVAFFLWLYLLWTTIRFTFFATLVPEGVDPDDSANPLNVLLALVLPGPSMWFLYALALFSVVGKLLRPVPVAVQLAASGVLSAVAGAGLLEIDSRWVAICRFLFFFLLGWHAKRLVEGVARASNLPLVAAAAAVCVAAAGGAVALGLRTAPGVAWLLNCLAVSFGVLFAGWITRYAIGRPLVALGRRTLPIYLIHMLPLALVVGAVRHLALPTAVAYALPFAMTAVLIGLSLAAQKALVAAGGTWLFTLPDRLAYRPASAAPAREPALAGRPPSG